MRVDLPPTSGVTTNKLVKPVMLESGKVIDIVFKLRTMTVATVDGRRIKVEYWQPVKEKS